MLLTDALSKAILEALQNRLAPEADARLASELEKLSPRDSRALVSMAQSSIGDGSVFGDNNISIVFKLGNAATGAVLREQMEKLRPFFQIPAPPVDFVGRATELDDLRAGIARGGVAISGLAGMGGIGKTALACKLAKELASDYPDAAFYLDLRGVEPTSLSAADALRHFIRSFEPTMQLPDDVAALRSLYLSRMQNQRAVVLLDNAKDAAQIAPLLPLPNCAVIVTSRQYFVAPGLTPQRLEKLAPDDARALLLKIAPRIGDAAKEMARVLGYLPLALRLAASALAERANLTPEKYLSRLSESSARLGLTDATRAETEPRTIEAIFQLSYDLLDTDDQTRWRKLAVFADTFDEQATAAIWRTDEDDTNDALGRLCNFSMVDYDVSSERYSVHDLARDFGSARLNKNSDESFATQRSHATYYLFLLERAGVLFLQGNDNILRGLQLFDYERANIEAGQAWAVSHSSQDGEAAHMSMYYPNVGTSILSLRQPTRKRIIYLEAALLIARHLKEREIEGKTLGNLSNAHADLGDIRRSVQFCEQALEIVSEISDRQAKGTILGNLGIGYADLGEISRAVGFYEQALEIAREMGDRRGEGNTLGNLANAYARQGEIHRATKLYRQQLEVTRKIGDRQGESNALIGLGRTCIASGETRLAINFHKQALTITREIGARHSEGYALTNLGEAYSNVGQTSNAKECHERALEITRETSDRRGESNALYNVGNSCVDQGEMRNAIEYYEQALEIARETGDRKCERNAIGGLGVAYAQLGEIQHAIEFLQLRLTISRELGERTGEAKALGSLGIAYVKLGEIQRAIEPFQQQLEISRETNHRFGEGAALLNMSQVLRKLGKRTEAIESATAALRIFEQIEAPNTEEVRRQLAQWQND